MRKMKDSGIEWIGEIPSEWKVIKCKHLIEVKSGDAIRNELLSSNGKYQVFGGGEILGYTDVYNANESNLLIGRVGARCGCVTRPFDKVFATDNALVVIPKSNRNFLYYVLISFDLNRLNTSNAQPLITSSKVKNITIPVPLVTTQQKIADFLDKKCSEIDSTISKTRESIEEYKKLKQAIITEVVTKGLNPNAKMKDSGIEWIGEIPEEWEVRALKSLFHIFSGTTPKSDNPEFWDEDIKWVTPADFSTENVFISGGKRNLSKKGLKSYALEIIPRGSLIFSKRAPIGKVCINTDEMCTNQGCLACVKKVNLDIKFFYYLLSVFTELFELLGSGTTFKEISLSAFSDFRLPVPPLTSQLSLITYLDKKCSEIDKLITKKEQLVVELEAYKKSLIYEVVTGKRSV